MRLASDLLLLYGCLRFTPGISGDACSWTASLGASCAVDCLGVCTWKAWLRVSVTVMSGRNPEERLGVMHRPASCCFSLLLQVSFDCLWSLLAWMPLLGLIWLSGLAFLRLTGAGNISEERLMLRLIWVLCRQGSSVSAALSLSQGGVDADTCTDSCCPFWMLAIAVGIL